MDFSKLQILGKITTVLVGKFFMRMFRCGSQVTCYGVFLSMVYCVH